MSIYLSSRLRNILMKIGDNISRFILSLEDNHDYSFQFSFLDITDDESTISFLQANKYAEIPRERGNGDAAWTSGARNEIRIGRLIVKIAPFYKSYEIEAWVNAFKAEYKNALKNIKFKVVEGYDIVKFYNGKRYARGSGSLNKSCMRYDKCGEFMDLYTFNQDKIKMLILLEGKDIIGGRALLWKLDEPKDTWLLDRIYVKEDSDAILFKKHAEKNGWLYKSQQTFDAVKVVKERTETYIDMRVDIKGDYKYFPYIDTLLFYNKKDKYLTNNEKEYDTIPHMVKLRETSGSDSGNENFVYDVLHKEIINIEDACFCFYGDGYTHKNNAFFIKEFDEFVLPSELRYSTHHKRFLTNQSSVYSKNIGSFMMESEVYLVYLSKDKKYFDYLLRSDRSKIYERVAGMGSSTYFDIELLVKGIDGQYYFKDEYDDNKVKEIMNFERNAVDEVIKSSSMIRGVMGIDKRGKKKKYTLINEEM